MSTDLNCIVNWELWLKLQKVHPIATEYSYIGYKQKKKDMAKKKEKRPLYEIGETVLCRGIRGLILNRLEEETGYIYEVTVYPYANDVQIHFSLTDIQEKELRKYANE